MSYNYVLKLEDGKYYVGRTNSPKFRLDDHFSGDGSLWTSIYQPVEVVEFRKTKDECDENDTTIEYMKKYGIDNVRGGSFCKEHLDKDEKHTLKKIIGGDDLNENDDKILNKLANGDSNCCYRCGRKNHFISNCYAKTHINGHVLEESDIEESDENKFDEDINEYEQYYHKKYPLYDTDQSFSNKRYPSY